MTDVGGGKFPFRRICNLGRRKDVGGSWDEDLGKRQGKGGVGSGMRGSEGGGKEG